MKPLFRILKQPATGRRHALECDIAARCAEVLGPQLYADIAAMGLAEARGYLRARALTPVRHAVRQATNHQHISAAVQDALLRAALERTVRLVIEEAQAPPVVPLPLPHVARRSAA